MAFDKAKPATSDPVTLGCVDSSDNSDDEDSEEENKGGVSAENRNFQNQVVVTGASSGKLNSQRF